MAGSRRYPRRLQLVDANIIWLVIAWILGQILVAVLFGRTGFVQFGGDSGTFLSAAERFPFDQGTLRGYSGYVAVLAVGQLIGSASWFLLFVQNAALLAAGHCVIDIGRRMGSRVGGLLGALALLLNPLFAQWFRYVLTETLFVSGLIILTWTMLKSATDGGRWHWWALLAAVTVASLRPNGVLLVPSTLTFLAWLQWRGRHSILTRVAMVFPWLLVGLAALTLSSAQEIHGSENSFAAKTVAGEVFWNEPETALSMPEPTNAVVTNRDVVGYAIDNPVAVARLYGARLGYELLQIRPRYSTQLNLFAIVTTPLLWLAAAIGLWGIRRTPFARAVLLVIVPQALLISVTWATPEGRFGWWLLGPSLVLAGLGVASLRTLVGDRLAAWGATSTSNAR